MLPLKLEELRSYMYIDKFDWTVNLNHFARERMICHEWTNDVEKNEA